MCFTGGAGTHQTHKTGALATHDPDIVVAGLNALQKVVLSNYGVGEAMVPFYRQLLQPMNLFYTKRQNIGDQIFYGQRKGTDLGTAVLETLEFLEKTGGPNAFVNIKSYVPVYECARHWLASKVAVLGSFCVFARRWPNQQLPDWARAVRTPRGTASLRCERERERERERETASLIVPRPPRRSARTRRARDRTPRHQATAQLALVRH